MENKTLPIEKIRLEALKIGVKNGVFDEKQRVLIAQLDRYAIEIGLLLPPTK